MVQPNSNAGTLSRNSGSSRYIELSYDSNSGDSSVDFEKEELKHEQGPDNSSDKLSEKW